jgi:hypothetical protein
MLSRWNEVSTAHTASGEPGTQDEIACPICAEQIKASARKCRFCGEWLDSTAQTPRPINASEQASSAEQGETPRFGDAPTASPSSSTAPAGRSGGTNGLAVVSLVLALVGLPPLGSIPAVIVGRRARKRSRSLTAASAATALPSLASRSGGFRSPSS